MEPVVAFKSGEGYPSYRIPGLATTRKGTLLAFMEGREEGDGDHRQQDMVLKRSTDNGKTWGELIVVHEDGDHCLVNPCPVVLDSGRILLMYQFFPAGYDINGHRGYKGGKTTQLDAGLSGPTVSKNLLVYSDDDGKTWSKPRDVTAGTKRAHVLYAATGPGNGIVLEKGAHKGRIVIPCVEGFPGRKTANVYAAYSDDDGQTWQMGEPAKNAEQGFGHEVAMAELSDGSVMANTRVDKGKHCRQVAISRDGGASWATPLTDDENLVDPRCQGTLIRYSFEPNILLFANPASDDGRKDGTIKISYDDGESWSTGLNVCKQRFSYSSLSKLKDGSIGLLYEHKGEMRFVRVTLDEVKAEK